VTLGPGGGEEGALAAGARRIHTCHEDICFAEPALSGHCPLGAVGSAIAAPTPKMPTLAASNPRGGVGGTAGRWALIRSAEKRRRASSLHPSSTRRSRSPWSSFHGGHRAEARWPVALCSEGGRAPVGRPGGPPCDSWPPKATDHRLEGPGGRRLHIVTSTPDPVGDAFSLACKADLLDTDSPRGRRVSGDHSPLLANSPVGQLRRTEAAMSAG
jgi:hypothetical protein